jgi:hypothetical protein
MLGAHVRLLVRSGPEKYDNGHDYLQDPKTDNNAHIDPCIDPENPIDNKSLSPRYRVIWCPSG